MFLKTSGVEIIWFLPRFGLYMTVQRWMCHTLATTSHRIHLALFLRRLMTILMMAFIYLLFVAVRLLN